MKKDLTIQAEDDMHKAAYVWSMNTNLGDGKMLQVTGNFSKGASTAEMSGEVDKIAKVFAIQRLKLLEIPTCEGALRDQARAADHFTDELDKLIDENREKERVPSNIKQHMENLRENIRKTAENIEEGKRHLDTLIASVKELEAE